MRPSNAAMAQAGTLRQGYGAAGAYSPSTAFNLTIPTFPYSNIPLKVQTSAPEDAEILPSIDVWDCANGIIFDILITPFEKRDA